MAMSIARYSDHYQNNRMLTAVSHKELSDNKYLNRCQILNENRNTQEVVMYFDEVEVARREHQSDIRYMDRVAQLQAQGAYAGIAMYGSQVAVMQSVPGTSRINYYEDWGGYQSIITDPSESKHAKEQKVQAEKEKEKTKKHASNLMKCYWARYQKNKELAH